MTKTTSLNIVALAGGVGGSRLCNGLAKLLSPEQFSMIVNTGDDMDYWGLSICPDLDTVMYTLAGVNNPETGWGLIGETYTCLESLKTFGMPSWFGIGDKDLATHITRSAYLKEGLSLTDITALMAEKLGVKHPIYPMCDQPYRTIAVTKNDEFDFQTYFVAHKWQPELVSIRWETKQPVSLNPNLKQKLENADVIIISPSNPFVSIDPILSVPGMLPLIQNKPVIAVSPIIGGQAVKGPAAKMFPELINKPASALAVAQYYQERYHLNGFVMDNLDQTYRQDVEKLGIRVFITDTLMKNQAGQIRLAGEILAFCRSLV